MEGQTFSYTSIHRPRNVFERGDQIGVITNGRMHFWGGYTGWDRPLPQRGSGVSPPENFTNFTCKMGHFGAKSHLVFIANKVQFWPKLLVTKDSLKLRNGNCTLNSPIIQSHMCVITHIIRVCDYNAAYLPRMLYLRLLQLVSTILVDM